MKGRTPHLYFLLCFYIRKHHQKIQIKMEICPLLLTDIQTPLFSFCYIQCKEQQPTRTIVFIYCLNNIYHPLYIIALMNYILQAVLFIFYFPAKWFLRWYVTNNADLVGNYRQGIHSWFCRTPSMGGAKKKPWRLYWQGNRQTADTGVVWKIMSLYHP